MAEKSAFDYVNEIWGVTNYVRDVIRDVDYNKVILPFAALGRIECALDATRESLIDPRSGAKIDAKTGEIL